MKNVYVVAGKAFPPRANRLKFSNYSTYYKFDAKSLRPDNLLFFKENILWEGRRAAVGRRKLAGLASQVKGFW